MTVFSQLPLTNVIKQFVTIYFLPWLNDFLPADWSRAIVDNSTDHWKLSSICLITLIKSSGSEKESPRIADFRLVSSRRKETRDIDLNTVGWEDNEGINGACRHFSWPRYIHHAVRTECLRPPQIHSHYKRIIPSLTWIPFTPLLISNKLLIQILSLRQGVPQWWYRSLKLGFTLNPQTNMSPLTH